MKVYLKRKTVKRNSEPHKKSRIITPVSSKKREGKETSVKERNERCRKNIKKQLNVT
jgi:hypothetical protein